MQSPEMELVWRILKDLSDRAQVPEWLGDENDDAAVAIAAELAQGVALPFFREQGWMLP